MYLKILSANGGRFENAFENVVSEMAAILSQPRYVILKPILGLVFLWMDLP